MLSREVLDVDYWATAKELPLNSSKTKTILIGYGILPPKKDQRPSYTICVQAAYSAA